MKAGILQKYSGHCIAQKPEETRRDDEKQVQGSFLFGMVKHIGRRVNRMLQSLFIRSCHPLLAFFLYLTMVKNDKTRQHVTMHRKQYGYATMEIHADKAVINIHVTHQFKL